MTLLARSKPYPTTDPKTYVCKRCGIQKPNHSRRHQTHCKDCKRFVKDQG